MNVFGGPRFGGVPESEKSSNDKRAESMRKRWAEKKYRQEATEKNRKQGIRRKKGQGPK